MERKTPEIPTYELRGNDPLDAAVLRHLAELRAAMGRRPEEIASARQAADRMESFLPIHQRALAFRANATMYEEILDGPVGAMAVALQKDERVQVQDSSVGGLYDLIRSDGYLFEVRSDQLRVDPPLTKESIQDGQRLRLLAAYPWNPRGTEVVAEAQRADDPPSTVRVLVERDGWRTDHMTVHVEDLERVDG